MMLDERLSLAASLYEPCEWGADIGTDHAFLPCHLLKTGICRRMICADVSPKALENARRNLTRCRLLERTELVLADGLDAVDRPCGCVSVMGMGGETMSHILRNGRDKLQGAVLVLGAHTELPFVRQAIADIGYHIQEERLCRAAGRFYVFWRAEEGAEEPTEEAILYGEKLWQGDSVLLADYAAWRRKIALAQLTGLQSAVERDEEAIHRISAEADWYAKKQEELPC